MVVDGPHDHASDNIQFTLMTNNSSQIHFNAHYSAQSEFKRPLVNSFLTLALVTGLMTPDTNERGVALGVKDVTLPHPLFEGDTLYADTEVVEARPSKSRPGWGIVTLKQRGFTFVGTTICYSFMQATGMVNDHVATCFRFDLAD